MRPRSWLAAAVIVIAGLSACARAVSGPTAIALPERQMPARLEGTTLRVASFNILQAGNRQYPWANRRESVVECLRDIDPDVFGVQEALWPQLEYLIDAFPGYTCVGRGRDDGHRAGEFMAVFYRTDRFVLRRTETFWLSDTPEIPGSNTWNAACNRVATVAVLTDRTDGTSVGICNTHLDHVSGEAREKGSALIRRKLPAYGEGLAWAVTGDFNARPSSTVYNNLVGGQEEPRLIDTYAAIHPSAAARRIDWILVSPQFETLAAGICRFNYRGIRPSDHYPVWADLRRPE